MVPCRALRVGEYYEDYWAGDYHDPCAGPRAARLWGFVDSLPARPRSFLDIGCGRGQLVGEALRRGMDATGTDISETALEQARAAHPGGTFTAFPVEERPWPVEAGSFDLVVSFEVIEHLFWPRDLVAGCFEALAPGGHLAISTPYHGRLKNLALALVAFDRHFDVEGQHIRFFSDRALRALLTDCGFEHLSTTHVGRAPGLWANTTMFARKPG